MRTWTIGIALAFASSLSAQTVQHVSATAQALTVSATLPNPQTQGNTLVVGVYPNNGIVSDSAGDTFVQDCSNATFAIFHAANVTPGPNKITYTIPAATWIGVFASEQPGQQHFTTCGTGTATAPGPINVTEPVGNLVYAMLSSSSGSIGTTLSPGMTLLDGQIDTFWGAGIYSGYAMDAVGIPTGPLFTYVGGLGNGNGTALTAAYSSVAPLAPVTLTFAPSASTMTPCTDTISYDDGSNLFGPNAAPESVMELENGAWVNIGTPIVQPNGLITGSITVNPNFTDSNGNVELQLLVGSLLGIPPSSALPITPAQLANGATGICGSIVIYKANGTVKYETFGLTP